MDFVLNGYIKPGYEAVGDAFIKNFTDFRDLGAAAAVMEGEELVVDIWGGQIHDEKTPWEKDTLVNVWSTTKGFVSLAAHMLMARGKLDIEKPVAAYWEEFAASGKSEITVRQLLNHRSGMAGWREKVPVGVLYDWKWATDLLAAQKTFWEPGEASGYHLLSYGHLVGEVIRRIDGRPVDVFIREEIAEPLELDFHMPLTPFVKDSERAGRVSDVVLMPTTSKISAEARAKLSEVASYVFTNPLARVYDANSPEWRAAVIPAANGHTTARAVAKMYSLLANGGSHRSITLLSPEDVEKMREPAPAGKDLILGAGMGGADLIWGLGYRINHDNRYGPNPRAFYHGGFGGSLGFADPESGLSFSYTMNRMDLSSKSGDRASNLLKAVYAVIS